MPQFQPQRLSCTEATAWRPRRRPPVRALVRALAVAGVVSHLGLVALSPAAAQALPSGMNVVHGQATAAVNGNRMTVTNSANAVLNWQAFSVGAGQQVRFEQPGAASRVLNRVVGNDPSRIFGSISSNGQVWLLNPHGVLFGRDARVDVGSLVVSTLGLPLADWLSGRGALSLSSLGAAGAAPIVNQGELRAASGGRIWLLGGDGGVRNEGLITAPDGQVALAAGRTIDLVDERLPHVAVRVGAPAAEVLNLGRVAAGGGRVDLLSAVVNQSGIVQADSIGPGTGVVRLQATASLQLAAGSVTSANGSAGADGGRVLLDAGPQGTLLAAGSVLASGSAGLGGEVQMLGRHVGLIDAAVVDASGAGGGGQVFVGGGLQGKDASLRNAEAVYLGPAATVRADATVDGDGGRIILWGDQAARAYGTLSARGGASGGNGGFIETSGGWLDARPASVRTDAAAGHTGQWLLDPYDIDIVSSSGDLDFGAGPSFTSSATASQLSVDTIVAALMDNNVQITTGDGGTDPGDIGMSFVSLSVALPGPRSLTLDAARDINLIAATIENTGSQALTVNLNAGRDVYLTNSYIYSYGGPLTASFDAGRDITLAAGSSLYAGAGPLSVSLTAGRHVTVGTPSDGGADVYSISGPANVTIDAGGDVAMNDASVYSIDGPLGVTVNAAGGSVSFSNTFVFALDDDLTMTVDAGLDITLDDSEVFADVGAVALSLHAGGDVRIDTSDIGFSDPAQPLLLQVDAGGDLLLWGPQIRGEGAPSSVDFLAGGTIDIAGGTLIHLLGDDGVSLRAPAITVGSGTITVAVDGPVSLRTDSFANAGDLWVESWAEGTSIVLAGDAAPNTGSFTNSGYIDLYAGGNVARWLVYLADDSYTGDGLANYDFVQYNTTFPAAPSASGDGLVYASQAVLTLTNDGPITKVYDGTTQVTTVAPKLQVTGLQGGHTLVVPEVTGNAVLGDYASASVGTGIAIGVTSFVMPAIEVESYGGPVPVYGYTAEYDVRGDITRRPLTLSSVAMADKVYDGNRNATLLGGNLSNLVSGETLGLSLISGQFDTADAGSGKSVTGIVALANGTGSASNYQLSGGGAFVSVASITRRPLTLGGVVAADKVYDGSRTAALSGGSLGNLVFGQTLGLSLSNGLFDTAHAGTDKPVTGSAALVNGSGSASNYQLPGGGTFSTTADITRRPLTLGGVVAADKVYDGSRTAALTGGSLGNLVSGETLGLTLSTGLFDTADSGSGKTVTAEVVLADGSGQASDYQVSGGTLISTTAAITPRPLTLSGVSAVDKVYDGTPAADFTGGSLANLVAGQTLGVAVPDGVFDSADVGTGKPVTGTAVLIDGTGLASNYLLTGGAAVSTTAAISPRPLTIDGVLAADKVYDGNRDATVSGGSLANLVAGQTLGLSLGAAQFDTADAGTDKTVSGTATLSSGTGLASNYQLAGGATFSTTADITPRPLTLSGVAAAGKVYDGNRDATLTGGSLSNLLPGQTLGLSLADGLFDSADVGTDKAVSGTATLVDGSGLASNYQLTGSGTIAASADITRRPLTLSGVLAADKAYDGTREATLSGGSLANLVAGQTLGLTLTDGLFDTADAGTGKTVTGTAALADGSGSASNYELTVGSTVSTTANIDPRLLTVGGVLAADKVYDGTRDATLSGGSLGNLVAGQTLGLTLGNGLFDSADAGAAKPVTGTATLVDGTGLASNYTLADAGTVAATATITQRLLTLSGVAAIDRAYDGTRAATLSGGSLGNLVAGQTLGLALADGLFDSADVGAGKPVSGVASLVDGSGRASNYTLGNDVAVATTASITPRLLTIDGVVAADKVYDGTRDTTLSGGTLGNLVNGETLSLTLAGGLFDNANAGVGKPVFGTATLSAGTGQLANYALANDGAAIATASIAPRQLTLSGVVAADKSYDGTRDAALSGGSLANLVAGETLGLNLAVGQFDTAQVGVAKPVTGTATLVDGSGLAANYTLADAGALAATAAIAPRVLTVSGVLAADKTYDGTRDTALSGGSLVDVVAGETLTLAYSPGLFDTADAGSDKPVSGTATLGDGSGLVSNYQLASAGAVAATASIEPRPLTLSGVSAADKVYDGTSNATLSGGQLANLVAGEALAVVLSGGLFDTANVGLDKPVTGIAALADASGRASNYTLPSTGVAATADITPAALLYVADPVVALQGRLPAVLGGQVSGFVAGESVATATTGTLGFATQASTESLPGSYAVDGYGLTASNYTLAQAPGNAGALTVVPPAPTEGPGELADVADSLHLAPLTMLFTRPEVATMRTLDALQGMRTDRQGSESFGSIDVDAYSRDALAVLLEARTAYKNSLFGPAMKRLETDPGLADLPSCVSSDELDTGRCLVSDQLLARVGAEPGAGTDVGALAGVPPPPAPTAAPSLPPAVAVAPPAVPVTPAPVAPGPAAAAPAPAPAAPIAVAVVRPKTVALAKAPPIPTPRPVRVAALPQIQRKIAVLIGLDNYVDDRIPLLENAGRDVEAMARVLESQLGYQTVVVRDASREAIIGVLNKLALTARPNDSVVVYYAGHGTVVDATGLGYWIPASADADRPESWISNNDIGKLVGSIRASQVVLISDSCFSGSLVSDRRVRAFGGADDPGALLQRRAAVVMSSGGNEPVADGSRNGHSPFAASLMQSLSQLDNWRAGNTVFEQIRQDVTRRLPQTPHYGAARQGRHAEGADYVFEQRQLELVLR